MGGTPINTGFTVYSAICFVLVLAPLPWRFTTWNTGTVLFRIWAAIAILNAFINSIVWRQDAINRAPVWCDISSRILIGAHFAIPASTLCIIRRLYLISATFTLFPSPGEKRKAISVDLIIGLVYPLISIALYYVVQGHRFDVMEEVGCYPVVIGTWLSMVFIFCPIVIISGVSAVYAVLTTIALHRKRTEFNQFFKNNSPSLADFSSNSNPRMHASGGMTSGNYMRLMGLAVIQILVVLPFAVYTLVSSITSIGGKFLAYDWVEVHQDFSDVYLIPAILWRTFATTGIEYPRWLTASCGVLYFAIYGGTKESRTRYAAIFQSVGGWVKGVFGGVVVGRFKSARESTGSTPGAEAGAGPGGGGAGGQDSDHLKRKTKKQNGIVGEEITFAHQNARPGPSRARGRGRRLDLSFLSTSFGSGSLGNSTVGSGGGDDGGGSGSGSRWGRSRGAVVGSVGTVGTVDLEAQSGIQNSDVPLSREDGDRIEETTTSSKE